MLTFRSLSLRVQTTGPLCGVDIPFSPGLNLLRADNSSGKSTCLQAIIYALGLEGMLSARRDIPLAHAMTDSVKIEAQELRVTESWVMLEMENSNGEVLTVRRAVKSSSRDRALIQTWRSPVLTSQDVAPGPSQDYFVRRRGAAQREAGFHKMFAEYLGWQLPQVSRMDGSEGLLYLECLFPFFYVEQKHGWSGVQARIPTYFGIRDVTRRAAEFILSLDEYSYVLQRQRLESAGAAIEAEWRQTVAAVSSVADAASIAVKGIPGSPRGAGTEEIAPSYSVYLGSSWLSLDEHLSQLASRMQELASREVRAVGENTQVLEEQLRELQDNLTELNSASVMAATERRQAAARLSSVELRVEALEEDLQRHKDAALLVNLGSDHTPVFSNHSVCPTCQQEIADGFDITDDPMTVEESINYIETELATFRAMRNDYASLVDVENIKLKSLQVRSGELRRQIRAVKDALTAPSATPSVAELTERLKTEDEISSLRKAQSSVYASTQSLQQLSLSWQQNRQSLKQLSDRVRSPLDRRKVEHLQGNVVSQLQQYHFSSLDPKSVEISEDTYRPSHEGFDLGFDLSASDMIRVIWAYLLGVLETSITYGTNHPRMLMFDEPRQQETQEISFRGLLERAARVAASGAQVIFATSWPQESLGRMTSGLPHKLVSFPPEVKLLRPMDQ
ncbi:AAA family ATPase [Actinomadura sp. NTSP31]|uniref:ATP-binding protein n=1 Tax=Actinomadura sp. NTSP31 TaxID=1735447 RepID=UPI0035BEFED7